MSQKTDLEPVEILELFQKRPTVIRPGLERIRAALNSLGNPGLSTPRVVVGGTNGKGSTSGMIWRLLAAGGLRVGLFSSPHLEEFRERITVSGVEIRDERIVKHIQDLRRRLPSELWEELTFFEINTILAFLIFDELRTDVNVLEVGLGGRLDCVNVYDPDVSVISSIGHDHAEFLGNTLAGIAREKSGIMRAGRPVIWGGRDSSEVEAHEAVCSAARDIGAVLISEDLEGDIPWPASLAGRPSFFRRNFRLAALAVREFMLQNRVESLRSSRPHQLIERFDDPALPRPVTFTGRFDLVAVRKDETARYVLLDVCHNPHGARALAKALEETAIVRPGQTVNCLISVLSDKDAAGIWNEIKGKINELIRFKIPSPRTWQSDDIRIGGELCESFKEAWMMAVTRESWRDTRPWLVFGSVAAVGEVLAFWRRDGWTVDRISSVP